MNNAPPFPDIDLPEDVIEALFECKAVDVRSFAQVADTFLAQTPEVLAAWNGTHTETCMALAVKVWMLRGLLEVDQRRGPSWAEVDRAIKLCKAVPLAPQRPLTAPPTIERPLTAPPPHDTAPQSGAVLVGGRTVSQHQFVFVNPPPTQAQWTVVATGFHRAAADAAEVARAVDAEGS